MLEVLKSTEAELAVNRMMLADYEKVIFTLLRKLKHDPDEINVVMNYGSEMHEFQIKKPQDGLPVVSSIAFSQEI